MDRTPYEQAWDQDHDAALIALDILKINRASLAAEARINRKLAQQRRGLPRYVLNSHRTGRLRQEARASHLAYCYLRGRTYYAVEGTTRKKVPLEAVQKKVRRMGKAAAAGLESWFPKE